MIETRFSNIYQLEINRININELLDSKIYSRIIDEI